VPDTIDILLLVAGRVRALGWLECLLLFGMTPLETLRVFEVANFKEAHLRLDWKAVSSKAGTLAIHVIRS
jgi:hypothetical protein